mmetsp:Transcript_19482/g.53617  ORF Transcript_19482/g.53617 Transcript_19482/m.53617 type:complete len:322 (+) Transcript_19482:482-1447(+)
MEFLVRQQLETNRHHNSNHHHIAKTTPTAVPPPPPTYASGKFQQLKGGNPFTALTQALNGLVKQLLQTYSTSQLHRLRQRMESADLLSKPRRPSSSQQQQQQQHNDVTTRQAFLSQLLVTSTTAVSTTTLLTTTSPQPVFATGRATLDVTWRRYAPRVRAGGEFYATDLKRLVAKNDWQGIQTALQQVPDRSRKDLSKADAGVAERARQAGGFSDARVLVAADLLASAFSSQNSLSDKTRKMKTAVDKVRETTQAMELVTKQALGQDSGGFFGLGKKKVSEAELAKQMRQLYAQGGTAWNEYVYAANENLALQFDRFEYIQ